ncbi:IucA/IucC family protein [Peteryoungia ipomoeae]|uniref:Rhizobactin siderophore biosynthesis protein RhsF n=1 Tax=Peteryoungia ipomoeae TaxID=1210932 RepID=A0A4S8NS80_9HYPH|nr:IucA/IucC family protein [Peteryoungia ipomoeae]THV20220.1 rhizobactin siderophore biosynthesis protein RhsF [Peteryoungia ipomoeae]
MPLPLDLPAQPEERVLRQLVSALLFEGIALSDSRGANDGTTNLQIGAGEARAALRRGPFGRPRLTPGSIELRCPETRGWTLGDLNRLIDVLPAPEASRKTLLDELKSTIRFLDQDGIVTTVSDRRALSFDRLDCALAEAHPYHPCFKSRTGFSLDDNALFGPEAGRAFRLHWLAVERQHVREALPCDSDQFWQDELGEGHAARVLSRMKRKGLSHESHALVPIHPWQWRHLKDGLLADWIADGRVTSLGENGDPYRATQSIRTLVNHADPTRAHVKLPLDIVNTSSMRGLEPHSIVTAPHLSHWLAGLIEGDEDFNSRYPVEVLQEYAGIRVDAHGALDGKLGVMLRESPKIRPGEQAVPFNALMMLEADGQPFIAPWIAQHGLRPWLQRMLEVAILPVWHLMVHHGVALEAHGQNMILVLRNGWPERLILRDFHESVEFCPALLRRPQDLPNFVAIDPVYEGAPSDAYYWTDHANELRELVMDCLFIYCLTEVSLLIETAYGLTEHAFWSMVSELLDGYGEQYADEARLSLFAHDQPEISTESLLSRKLFRDRSLYRHRVPNPLGPRERSDQP